MDSDGGVLGIDSDRGVQGMDSDGGVFGMDVEAALQLLEDSYAPWFWLDSCDSNDSIELSEMILQSLFTKSDSFKSVLMSKEASLLEFLSSDKPSTDLSALPLVSPDLYLSISAADCSTTAVENRQRTTPQQPVSSTEDYQGVTHFLSPLRSSQGQSRSAGCGSLSRPPTTRTQEPICSKQKVNNASRQVLCSSSQIEPSAPQEALKTQTLALASCHELLVSRAGRAKLRLQALLGEHAVQRCTGQWQGPVQTGGPPTSSLLPVPKYSDTPVKQNGRSRPLDSQSTQLNKGAQSLVLCGRAALQRVQTALDSDATASSSDEECDDRETTATTATSECLGCEWRWQCERAELASRWTWLQVRLSELDCRIQQLSTLHKNILACKGGVVLAKSQPLTDLQIQQMLLKETTGLALTARNTNTNLDTEPSSPSRLLWNIERQSAQLNRIVNNLMAPLNLSPSSSSVAKGACSHWKGQQKQPYHSFSGCEETGPKKRRMCRQRLFPPRSCVSARTRPLVTYHKPRLFTLHQSPIKLQRVDPSDLCYGSCVCCDPVKECSDPVCSCTAKITASRAHPMPLPSDSRPVHVLRGLARENWLRQDAADQHFITAANTPHFPFSCTHQLPVAKHAHTHKTESTPVCLEPLTPTPRATPRLTPGQTPSRALKRRHLQADADLGLSHTGLLCPSPVDSGEEVVTPNSTSSQQRHSTPKFPVRSRNDESVYNINNIVLPRFLAASTKVEKLQYKDILTPSWRIVDVVPLVKEEEEDDEDDQEEEQLSDEVFSERHQSYDLREKLRWNSWDDGRRHGISSSSCMNEPVHGAEQLCSDQLWACRKLGALPELSLEEMKVQLPWEKRLFPLSREEEDELRCEEDAGKIEDTLWSQKTGAATPSAGHREKKQQPAEVSTKSS